VEKKRTERGEAGARHELDQTASPRFRPVTRRAGAKRRTPEAKPEGLTGAKGAIRSTGLRTVIAMSRRGLAGPWARGWPRPRYRARDRGRGVRLT
jgi:hypothetical protein